MSTAKTIADTIEEALHNAGLDTRTGAAAAALDSVRKALSDANIAQGAPSNRPGPRSHVAPAQAPDDVIDIEARVRERFDGDPAPDGSPAAPPARSGALLRCVHSGPAGRRGYRLYVPGTPASGPMPLIVMLHGCKQTPEDFAAGTRLNALADEFGFLVAYPAQPAKANGSRCWNWFDPQHQARHGAEPATLAGIVQDVRCHHRIDERRVFVAGLSAGAAMAVILGETHPEVFAAVGAHSGLPYGAAHDVPSAFAVMRGDARHAAEPAGGATPVPTIVFHGDRDTTVAAGNGHAIAQQAVARFAAQQHRLTRFVEQSQSGSRRATRIIHADAEGRAVVEQWIVHGGVHAWSGGHADGSFTDPLGPDASREMVRFFLQAPVTRD